MPKPKGKPEPEFDPTSARITMERILRATSEMEAPDHEEQSMDYFFKAAEATTAEDLATNLKKALELDPGNVDALLMMTELIEEDGAGRISALRAITELAAHRLGEQAFTELKGAFWGFIETRPYMRAREMLAAALREDGRMDEAIVEYEAMLKLNPNDNQGIRYSLLPGYLMMGDLKGAKALMKKFKDEADWSVVFAWCAFMERYLSKDFAGAKSALEAARKQNPHMEAFLTGKKKPPKEMPPHYSSGSLDEAVCYLEGLLPLWNMHPEIKEFMANPTVPSPSPAGSAPPKPRSKPRKKSTE